MRWVATTLIFMFGSAVTLSEDRRITLAWDNQPEPSDVAAILVTGLEGSTNLVDWYELVRMDYVTNAIVTLTNRPQAGEYYRAFNSFK